MISMPKYKVLSIWDRSRNSLHFVWPESLQMRRYNNE